MAQPEPSAPARRHAPIERRVRLTTGVILFSFATSHFLNHACGILRVPTMDAIRVVLLWPWRTIVGQTLLYGSLLVHGSLGFFAILRRRHLWIPPSELTQILLGLSIPPLIIIHAVNVRLGHLLFDLPLTYPWLLYRYWHLSLFVGVPRQFLLLLVIWIYGCIGLRSTMRFKPWYPGWMPFLAALAALIPILAISGIIDAGHDFDATSMEDPGFLATFKLQTPEQTAALGRISETLILIYLGLVGALFALSGAREWHQRRFRAVTIGYPGGRRTLAPRGFSILEASRYAGIPHTSMCGGRGRCSTCRIRVNAGMEALPPPNAAEAKTLAEIGARRRHSPRLSGASAGRCRRRAAAHAWTSENNAVLREFSSYLRSMKSQRSSSIYAIRRSSPTVACPMTPSMSSIAMSAQFAMPWKQTVVM